MVEVNQDVTLYKNNKATLRYVVVDNDAVGTPRKDITGLVIKWAMSIQNDNGQFDATSFDVEKKSTVSGEVTVTNAAQGELDVDIISADTISLPAASYRMQLEAFDGSEGVMLSTGKMTLLENITNT